MIRKIQDFIHNHRFVTAGVEALFGIILVGIFVTQSLLFSTVFLQLERLAAVLPSVLVLMTNTERDEANLPQLQTSEKLQFAAQMKANDMAAKGYFAHTSPEGITPWFWLNAAGYSYEKAGENLAVNFADSNDVVRSWMDSPTHKANILSEKYREVGIATATGVYKGREAIFVVQFFGTKNPGVIPEFKMVDPVSSLVTENDLTKDLIKTLEEKRNELLLVQEQIGDQRSEEISQDSLVLGVEDERSVLLAQNIELGLILGQEISEEKDGVETPTDPSLGQQLLASPKLATLIFSLIILFFILLKIAHGLHVGHPKRILLGVILLILVLTFMFIDTQIFIGDI